MDLESASARAWAAAAPTPSPAGGPAAGGGSSAAARGTRTRVLASSRTRPGWFIAASPLLLMATLTLLAAGVGGLSWAEIGLVVCIVALANSVAAGLDVRELERRGFVDAMSRQTIWATPFVYLFVRARHTRDDFHSYRLVWANVGFTAAAFVFVVGAVFTATWFTGMAALHPGL